MSEQVKIRKHAIALALLFMCALALIHSVSGHEIFGSHHEHDDDDSSCALCVLLHSPVLSVICLTIIFPLCAYAYVLNLDGASLVSDFLHSSYRKRAPPQSHCL